MTSPTHTWFFSNYQLVFYFTYHSSRTWWIRGWHHAFRLWNDIMHTSLLPCAGPTCTWQRRALTKPNLNVSLLKHQPCGPHFPAVTYLLELDGSRWTFSLEFKFLILHFWVQLDIFTVYFKIQRLPTQLYYDHSEYGIYYSQYCTSNERKAASIPQLGKNCKMFHFSILLSFSHNLFQLGKRVSRLWRTQMWEEELCS